MKGKEEQVSWKWRFIGSTRTHSSSTQVGNSAIGRAVEKSKRVKGKGVASKARTKETSGQGKGTVTDDT